MRARRLRPALQQVDSSPSLRLAYGDSSNGCNVFDWVRDDPQHLGSCDCDHGSLCSAALGEMIEVRS